MGALAGKIHSARDEAGIAQGSAMVHSLAEAPKNSGGWRLILTPQMRSKTIPNYFLPVA